MPNANIVEIYYMLDEFSKLFDAALQAHGLKLGRWRARRRTSLMSDAEVMTILVLFHTSDCRTLKAFYLGWVCTHGRADFPRVLSYSRFVERQQQVLPKLLLFLRVCALGRCTGISIVDSTPLAACHPKRARQHRTMRGLAAHGRGTMGWVYGFKLHLVINAAGEIIQAMLTPANTNDRAPLAHEAFTQKLFGRLVGDKGYISQALSERLLAKGIRLVTRIKRNMKNRVMEVQDKLLLRQRAVVETVIGMLKRVCHIEHTRHRSFPGFVANLCSGLIAYSFRPNKPKIHLAKESAAIHQTML